MEVTLQDITLALMQEYDRSFSPDPDLFMDMNRFMQYHYDPAVTQARYERYRQAGDRRVFLVMTEGKPVGEIMLKHIDMEKRQAELSIHLQNDTVKTEASEHRQSACCLPTRSIRCIWRRCLPTPC